MALLPQNPRDQRFVIVLLLVVGGAVAYQQLMWSPKSVELHQIATRLDTLDSLNRLAKAEVAKGSAAKMKQEAEVYGRELTVLRGLVPTQNEVPALLDMISSAARGAGLQLSDVAPDGIVQGDQFDTYRYKMGVTGPYHRVAEFLTNIGSLPRIIAPINVSLTPSASTTSEVKAKKGEQLLSAKFGVQTYVAHIAPPAAKPAAAASKPGAK